MLALVAQRQEGIGHPRKELCTQREVGLAQLRGRALSGLNKALGSIPSTTKREKKKSVTRKATILLVVDGRAGLGDTLTAGKIDRPHPVFSCHFENAFLTLSPSFSM